MLTVHWWRPDSGGHNLGDELTSIVLNNLFSVEHVHADSASAELISTGSILGWLWEKPEVRNRQNPVSIVGSGFMHPWVAMDIPAPARVYSVRGHLSRQLLAEQALGDVLLGDPGLLLSLVYGKRHTIKHKVGVIPHISRMESRRFHDRFKSLGPVKLIDFRTRDFESVLADMLSCETIVSHGLHGLILADAFGIPNAWLDNGPLHRGGAFKFHDYFSSVGRPFDRCIGKDEVVDSAALRRNLFEIRQADLLQVQQQAVEAFKRFFRDQGIGYTMREF